MPVCRFPARVTFLLAACLSAGLCQDAPEAPAPQNPAGIYGHFFELVARVNRAMRDGPADTLTQPSLQDAIGLTGPEMQLLNAAATEWDAWSFSFGRAASQLVFESRMRSIESGDSSASAKWLAPQTRGLDTRIAQAIAEQVRKLKAGLGDERFDKLDAYIHSPWTEHCFVGPCIDPLVVRPAMRR